MMADKEQILKLKEGESYIVPESDYGKAEIMLRHEVYFLFEIPMYGGRPVFIKAFPKQDVDKMIALYNSWT